jgi:hypothetical protein
VCCLKSLVRRKIQQGELVTFNLHPVVHLFSPLPAGQRQKLRKEIQRHACPPVVLWRDEDGVEYLIDGLPQAEICEELGVEVPTTAFAGTEEEAILHTWSLNKDRCELSSRNQRALIGARLAKLLSGDAAKRQRAGRAGKGSGTGKAAEKAAQMVGLSARTIEAAKTVLENGIPDLVQAVEEDHISISDAARVAKELPEEQRRAVKAVENGQARTATETMPKPRPAPVPQKAPPAPKPSMADLLTARYAELFQLLQEGQSVSSHPAFMQASEYLVASRRAIDLWKQCPDAEAWRCRVRSGG